MKMIDNLPYSTSVGTLEKLLDKVRIAPAPDRFTQDFVGTKLGMKGGSAKACIPFLKKMGFLGSDGVPTDLYREFRNPDISGKAVAKAFRILYERLYEMNEYVHEAPDNIVLGLMVRSTGNEHDNGAIRHTATTFKMLKKHADFETTSSEDDSYSEPPILEYPAKQDVTPVTLNIPNQPTTQNGKNLNLSYTINLNLPATKDIEVFNSIFKSLKKHLLED